MDSAILHILLHSVPTTPRHRVTGFARNARKCLLSNAVSWSWVSSLRASTLPQVAVAGADAVALGCHAMQAPAFQISVCFLRLLPRLVRRKRSSGGATRVGATLTVLHSRRSVSVFSKGIENQMVLEEGVEPSCSVKSAGF